VGNLNSGHSSLLFSKRSDLRQLADMFVFPDAQIGRRDAPLGFHGSGLRYHQGRATDGATSEVYQVPVPGESITT
jgi:hypothetical protein